MALGTCQTAGAPSPASSGWQEQKAAAASMKPGQVSQQEVISLLHQNCLAAEETHVVVQRDEAVGGVSRPTVGSQLYVISQCSVLARAVEHEYDAKQWPRKVVVPASGALVEHQDGGERD